MSKIGSSFRRSLCLSDETVAPVIRGFACCAFLRGHDYATPQIGGLQPILECRRRSSLPLSSQHLSGTFPLSMPFI